MVSRDILTHIWTRKHASENILQWVSTRTNTLCLFFYSKALFSTKISFSSWFKCNLLKFVTHYIHLAIPFQFILIGIQTLISKKVFALVRWVFFLHLVAGSMLVTQYNVFNFTLHTCFPIISTCILFIDTFVFIFQSNNRLNNIRRIFMQHSPLKLTTTLTKWEWICLFFWYLFYYFFF